MQVQKIAMSSRLIYLQVSADQERRALPFLYQSHILAHAGQMQTWLQQHKHHYLHHKMPYPSSLQSLEQLAGASTQLGNYVLLQKALHGTHSFKGWPNINVSAKRSRLP